jgi:hypothetical protein
MEYSMDRQESQRLVSREVTVHLLLIQDLLMKVPASPFLAALERNLARPDRPTPGASIVRAISWPRSCQLQRFTVNGT